MRRRLQDVRIKQVDDPPAGPSEVLLRLRIVRLVRSNTTLRVVATQRVVLRPIQITGMDAVLAVYPSRADALR